MNKSDLIKELAQYPDDYPVYFSRGKGWPKHQAILHEARTTRRSQAGDCADTLKDYDGRERAPMPGIVIIGYHD